MLAAGSFHERITLQSKSATRNAIGEEVVVWTDRATVWADVRPIRGREFFAAAQMQATIDTVASIRYRADVVAEWRLLWRGRPYDIRSVIDVGARRERIELMCQSGVNDGR